MRAARIGAVTPRVEDPRGEAKKEPEEVAAMMRLQLLGWGAKRIGQTLGCSHHTVKRYLEAGGVVGYRRPARTRRLDGLDDWLHERFRRHRGNADVIRQELAAEKDIAVSLRTVERAVAPYRQALLAEARATVRFEMAPGRQLQIDFGERLVEIGGAKVKAYLFVATLGYSRRLHVRAFRNERQESHFRHQVKQRQRRDRCQLVDAEMSAHRGHRRDIGARRGEALDQRAEDSRLPPGIAGRQVGHQIAALRLHYRQIQCALRGCVRLDEPPVVEDRRPRSDATDQSNVHVYLSIRLDAWPADDPARSCPAYAPLQPAQLGQNQHPVPS